LTCEQCKKIVSTPDCKNCKMPKPLSNNLYLIDIVNKFINILLTFNGISADGIRLVQENTEITDPFFLEKIVYYLSEILRIQNGKK